MAAEAEAAREARAKVITAEGEEKVRMAQLLPIPSISFWSQSVKRVSMNFPPLFQGLPAVTWRFSLKG